MSGNTDSGDDPIETMNKIEQAGREWFKVARMITDVCKLEKFRVFDNLQLANYAIILALRAEITAIGDTSQHPDVKRFIKELNDDSGWNPNEDL